MADAPNSSRPCPAPPRPPSPRPPPASSRSTDGRRAAERARLVRGPDRDRRGVPRRRRGADGDAAGRAQRAGRARRARPLDRRGAARAPRPGRGRGRPAAAAPAAGALALAVGRGEDGPLAAFGIVAAAGPAWTQRRRRADRRAASGSPSCCRMRSRAGRRWTPAGGLIGLAVADPRRRGLVIPAATVERAVAALAAKGYVGRGYLGLALQPLRRGGRRADRGRGRRGRAGGGGGLCRRRHRHYMGGRGAGLDARARPPARAGRGRAGRAVGVTRGGSPLELAVTVGERRPERGGRRGRYGDGMWQQRAARATGSGSTSPTSSCATRWPRRSRPTRLARRGGARRARPTWW